MLPAGVEDEAVAVDGVVDAREIAVVVGAYV